MNKDALGEFKLDNVGTEGITDDFVWYETDRLLRDMSAWESRMKKLSSVMEARHKEHLKMISDLLDENTQLKKKAQ